MAEDRGFEPLRPLKDFGLASRRFYQFSQSSCYLVDVDGFEPPCFLGSGVTARLNRPL